MRKEIVKKVGLWALVVALLVAHLYFLSQAHADTGWQEVKARSGDCRITFPVLPQMIEQNLKLNAGGELSYDVYLAPYQDKAVCLLLVAQYPAEVPPGHEKAGLDGLLKGILGQHPQNELIFAEMVKIQGFPAINFLVENGKNYFRGQALMVGSRLYLIAMEGMKEHFQETIFQRFIQSFQILK